MKTITVVSAETSTAPQTWRVPSKAACGAGFPASRKRKMFSKTTIAASTTMPTAKARPASEITLSERPSAAIATNEPMIETGIASETISVARQERRNNNSTNAAQVPGQGLKLLKVYDETVYIKSSIDLVQQNIYIGGTLAVAEAARNLVCSGAEPIGVTDCLNFGNPERPYRCL